MNELSLILEIIENRKPLDIGSRFDLCSNSMRDLILFEIFDLKRFNYMKRI